MPILGQPDTSIYGQTQLWNAPGLAPQGRAAGGQAGPTAGVMKFQADQQTEADMRQLAEQYGDDYDGYVDALSQKYGEPGYKAGKALEDWRKTGAERYKAQSEASSAALDSGLKLLQGADETNIGERVDSILKENPRLAPVLMPLKTNFTPERLQAVEQIGMNQKQFWDWQAQAADAILSGDKMKGLASAYAGASTPDQRAIVDRTLKFGGYGKLVGLYPDQQSAQTAFQQMDALKPEKSESAGSDLKQYLTKWASEHGKTYDQMTTADVDAANTQREKTMRKPVVAGGGGTAGGGLSTGPGGGLESLATQYRLTKRFPVGVARTISKQDANAAINLAAEQDRLIGRSPAASIQKAAMFQANAKAAGQMAVLGAGTEAAESKALGQIDIIKELSPKVWRTSSTGINAWLVNPTQQFVGDKDAQSLANAILTFSSEYSKIINGSVGSIAGASDSARNDAAKLISSALNHGNLMQQLKLMQREMALTRVGYDVAQQHIAEQMQGPSVPGNAPAAGTAPDAAALRQKYKY